MSSSSFGGLPPSAPAMDENVYEELQRRRAVEEWRRPPHPGKHFVSIWLHWSLLVHSHAYIYYIHSLLICWEIIGEGIQNGDPSKVDCRLWHWAGEEGGDAGGGGGGGLRPPWLCEEPGAKTPLSLHRHSSVLSSVCSVKVLPSSDSILTFFFHPLIIRKTFSFWISLFSTLYTQYILSYRHSSGGSRDFTSEVLTSVENLKASTRKTIYEPETDSGVSSSQNTMTSLPAVQNTTTTAIL